MILHLYCLLHYIWQYLSHNCPVISLDHISWSVVSLWLSWNPSCSKKRLSLMLLLLIIILSSAKLVNEDDLNDVLCEFDAVIEDFKSPVEKRHFRYDEHLKTMKRRSSASVSDSGISDSESELRSVLVNVWGAQWICFPNVTRKKWSNLVFGLCNLTVSKVSHWCRLRTDTWDSRMEIRHCRNDIVMVWMSSVTCGWWSEGALST